MTDENHLEPSKDKVKRLSSIIADIIIEDSEQVFPVIINIEDIVDLDKLVSSEAGLMDPLGQLKSWLTDMLNSIASWVADTVSSAVDQMIGGLKSFIDSALGGVKSFIEELIGGVTSAISTLESTVKKVVIDPLGKVIESAQKFLADLPKTIGGITGAVERVITSLSKSISGVADTVSKWLESLKATFSDTLKTFQDVISSAVKGISDIVGEAGKTLTSMVSGLVSSLQESFTKLMESASGVVGKLIESVQASFKSVEEWFSGLSQAFSDAMKTFSEMISSAGEGITKMISDVGATLSDTISNLISGAQELVGQLVDAIGGGLGKLQESLGEIFGSVGKWFEELGGAFTGAMKTFGDMINSAVKGISDMVSKAGETLSITISGLVEGAQKSFTGLIESVQKGISGVIESIQGAFKQVGDWVEGLRTAFEGAMKTFGDMVSSAVEGIKGLVSKAGEVLSAWVAGVSKQIEGINKLTTELIDILVKAPEKIPEVLMNIAETIWVKLIKPVYDEVYKTIIDPLQKALSGMIEKVRDGFDLIGKAFTGFINAVARLPEMLWGLLPDWLKKSIIGIQEAISDFVDKLKDFLEDPIGFLKEGFSWLAEQIWKLLPEDIKNAMIGLYNMWEAFVLGLKAFLEDPIKFIQDRFREFAEWLWKHLPDDVKNALIGLYEMWRSFVSGLDEFLKDPVGFIQDRFKEFAQWIWEHLPDEVKSIITSIQNFFAQAGDFITKLFTKHLPDFISWLHKQYQKFISDPLGYISGLIQPAINWLKENLGPALIEAGKWIVGAVEGITKAATGIISRIVQGVIGPFAAMGKAFTGIATTIGTTLAGLMEKLVMALITPVQKYFEETLKKIHKASSPQRPGEISAILGLGIAIMPPYLAALMLPKAFKSLSHVLAELRIRLEGSLEPLGLGGKIMLNVLSRINRTLYELGAACEDIPKKMAEGMIYGFTIWGLEPLRYPFRYVWKKYLSSIGLGWVPLELPPMSNIIEATRRFTPKEMEEHVRAVLDYRGYSDWFIEKFLASPEDAHIVITDRFGTKRLVPLALIYKQPSISDLARFMIRDIFGVGPKGLDQFASWSERLGLYKDIAFLYYLLHFRYPPPGDLWKFAMRGVAGLLWFVPRPEDIREAEAHAKAVGAFVPKVPTDLNFEHATLLSALSRYMKWHDYATFAWMRDYTSDNWTMIDLSADIPTKIDIRWMTKWALFDFMSEKKIGLETPVSSFPKVLEDRAANEKVSMDLTLMCRLLQATGLHPYYVPIVAVAESISALADERTFLRTGVVDMYRYGGSTYEIIDKLMSKLTIASFKVAYFDIEEKNWKKDKWINVPIMFLPAERKLLELRALLDRYNRVFRDVLKDVETAYKQFILDKGECVNALKRVAAAINKLFPSAVKEIAGSEFKFEVDEKYIETVIDSLEVERVIYTYRRVRAWFFRILGWMIYRLAYAYVTLDDINKLINIAKEYAKFTDAEIEGLRKIGELLIEIAPREYIPRPTTLASIAEVIPEAKQLFPHIVKQLRIPPAWTSVWKRYIELRPVIDEVRRLVTTLITGYAKTYITDEEWAKFEEFLKRFGYTKDELTILKTIATLRRRFYELREIEREYIPTPSMLATISEIIPEARALFSSVVRERHVPAEWVPIWSKYVAIKPIIDEVKKVLSSASRLYEYFMITEEDFKKFLNVLKIYGYEDSEIKLILDNVSLDRWYRAYRQLIGTPRELVTMAEYSPRARDLALAEVYKMIDALPIEQETKNFLKKMWEEYIRVKPVYDEVKREISELITDYARGIITWEMFVKLLEELKKWGIDEYEIDAYKFIAMMRKKRYEKRSR